MELEEPSIDFKPVVDRRPLMPEPPPVRLISIDDVHVPAAAGLETQLNEFYVGLLQFERLGDDDGQVIYKSARWLLRFDVLEPPIMREDFRPIQLEVPSLPTLLQGLIDREIDHLFQRGLMPGVNTVLLQDPAGNWLNVGEWQVIG